MNTKKDIGEKIYELRKMKGMTLEELGNKIGVGKSTVRKWETGFIANMRRDKIMLIAKALEVSPAYLMGWNESDMNDDDVIIPVYGRVAAGEPIQANQDNVIGFEKISKAMARRGDYYALQIKGDSMEPTICDGDTIIVREQPDAENGEIVVATINGDDATCKKLYKIPGGGIQLVSLNRSYDPFIFEAKDVEDIPVRVLGKVVEMRRRF